MKPILRKMLPTAVTLFASHLLLYSAIAFLMSSHALGVDRGRLASDSSFTVAGDGADDVLLSDLGPFADALFDAGDGVWLYEANHYEASTLPHHSGCDFTGREGEALIGENRQSEVRDGYFAWGNRHFKVVGTLGTSSDSDLSDCVVLSSRGLLDGFAGSELRFDGFGASAALGIRYPQIEARQAVSGVSLKTGQDVAVSLFWLGSLAISALGCALSLAWYHGNVRRELAVENLLGTGGRYLRRSVAGYAVVLVASSMLAYWLGGIELWRVTLFLPVAVLVTAAGSLFLVLVAPALGRPHGCA